MTLGLAETTNPVILVGVDILFAPLNVFCVAAAEIDPHERAPVASLSSACDDVGNEFGNVRRYVVLKALGVVSETDVRVLLFVLCKRN